ncbi:uncharacterized protein LOC130624965 isoform X2 [Hydractinia symbiolongicarpus]|uniref:uncharacterized protein LOC130624965 isoform X2 n=1 Tax=Hydractinia symbiolongicarpus TaxID=13093 RepID=UPI00254CA79B|nr:uncharacterized protein LOC130624965 isoform X2 [Hydractinia symbiolongicarpus]
MWILKEQSGSNHFILPEGNGISWKHAMFICEDEGKLEGAAVRAEVILRDMSKYGTTVGSNFLQNSSVILNEGDTIQLGMQSYTFRFEIARHVVTSCITDPHLLNKLKENLLLIGGTYVDRWSQNVTHLVMSKINLKLKLTCALASGVPIVTPEFFNDVISIDSQYPAKKSYLPPIAVKEFEDQEFLFHVNTDRMKLLHRKTFVSLSKGQFDYIKPAIQSAAGEIYIMQQFDTHILNCLTSKKMIVLELTTMDRKNETQEEKEWRATVEDAVKKSRIRMIPESEVCKAVITNSLEKYCNPSFSSSLDVSSRTVENNSPGSHGNPDVRKKLIPVTVKGEEKKSYDVKVIFKDGISNKNGKKILKGVLGKKEYTLTSNERFTLVHMSKRKDAKSVSYALSKDRRIKKAFFVEASDDEKGCTDLSNRDIVKAANFVKSCTDLRNAGIVKASNVGKSWTDLRNAGVKKNDEQHRTAQNKVDHLWKQIIQQVDDASAQHEQKLEQAKEELRQVEERKKMNNQTLDQLTSTLQLVTAKEKVVKELTDQKLEFFDNVKMIQDVFLRVPEPVTKLKQLQELALNVSLECQRLNAALPIYSKRSEIIRNISNHQVTILTAETGSGKSTQVVQYLYQVGYATSGVIVCTQPRKVAALSLAKRVADEMKTNVGERVGYSVGTSKKKGQTTSILFMTDQVLLNECLRDRRLTKYKCIVIDEAHERSIATDLLLAMIKQALKERPELRLIISSATIDPTVFEHYFQGMASRIHVAGRTFPVGVYWEQVNKRHSYLEAAVEKAKQVHQEEHAGDILVFLTTPLETEKAQERLSNDRNLQNKTSCLVLHGRLKQEEQQLVFDPAPDGKRKIVFATNSAETSITIPGIRYVIDTGMVKEKHFDAKKNSSSLRIGPISKSSAEQRMGRAGRTQEGKCYRLYTEDEFDEMEDIMLPEILRENLGLALLKLFQFGVEDPLHYDFVESPPKHALESALKELIKLDAVRGNCLTETGEKMAALSIEPKLAKFVTLGIEGDFPLEAVIIAAICSVGGNVFFRAGSDEEKQIADRLKTRFCSSFGDVLTLLEVYKEWLSIDDRSKNKWCTTNSMNAKTLRFTRELVNEMRSSLSKLCDIKFGDDFNDMSLVSKKVPKMLFRCFKRNLAYYSGHQRGGYYRLGDTEEPYFIHPSSALSFLTMTPGWVLFEEVLTTSRPYLLNVTAIPEEISNSLVGRDEESVVTAVCRKIVGKETAMRLGLGRYNGRLEVSMQKLLHQKVFIDLDENIGEATLYTVRSIANEAIERFDEAISKEMKRGRIKIMEVPISDGNPYSLIIGEGGQSKNLLSQAEYTSVLFGNVKIKGENQVKTVEKIFARFGEVSDVIKFKDGSFLWGKIVFTRPTDAQDAVCNKAALDDLEKMDTDKRIEVKPDLKNKLQAVTSQALKIRANWTRRQGKGYGFLSFDNDEHRRDLLRHRSLLVGNTLYRFKGSNKNLNEVHVTGIDRFYSNDQVKSAIAGYLPNVKITKCVIPRQESEIETPEVISALQRQLTMKIKQALDMEDSGKEALKVTVLPTKNQKDYDFRSLLCFQKVTTGQKLLRTNITMGQAMVRFTPELQSTVCIKERMYRLFQEDIKTFQMNAEGYEVKIAEKTVRREKFFEIAISSKDMENLSVARQRLYDTTRGINMQCTEGLFRFYLTPMGRQFIDDVKKSIDCIIEIDRRSKCIIGYVRKDFSEGFQSLFEKQKANVNKDEEIFTIYLTKEKYPRGFIKRLLEKFGVDFKQLYDKSKANYIEMNFLRHTLEIFGKQRSIDICSDMIQKLVSEVSEANIVVDETKTCPICFDSLSSRSHQLESCGHSYCKECIANMCKHAVKNNNLPIGCAAEDGCDDLVSIADISKFVETKVLVAAALDKMIVDNKSEYAYCVTPNCCMIYRKSEIPDEEPFQCPICQQLICTFCSVEYHTNISCAKHKRGGEEDDDSIQIWLSEPGKDRGICPKCTAPIERYDGCLHITCSKCKKHVCWRCKKAYFDRAEHCYDHICNCSGILNNS